MMSGLNVRFEILRTYFMKKQKLFLARPVAEFEVALQYEVTDKIIVSAALLEKTTQKSYTAGYEQDLIAAKTDKEQFKQVKRVVSHVYLDVLQKSQVSHRNGAS